MRVLHWFGLALALGALGFGFGLGLSLGDAGGAAASKARNVDLSPFGRAGAQSVPGSRAEIPSDRSRSRGLALAQPGEGSPRHTIVVDVAQRVSPAVVSIGVTKTSIERQYDPLGGDLFFPSYLVTKMKRDFPYLGSGFIIDRQGHVLTNYHVVEDSTSIQVTLTDRRTFSARLLDADAFLDVALLQIEGLTRGEILPAAPLGNSDDIMIGETALAIGNPFGPLLADPRPSVSAGVISALNRSVKMDEADDHSYQDMIQTDAAINPGNSGGPLVNLDGDAIGINTFIVSRGGDSAGAGFSIPINRAVKIANEIIRYGRLRAIRPGMELRELSPFLVQTLDLTNKSGALVWSVEVGGPAALAGLEPGDVILSVDGREIATPEDLVTTLKLHNVGDRLKLTVARQRRTYDVVYAIQEGRPTSGDPADTMGAEASQY